MLDIADPTRSATGQDEIHPPLDAILDRIGPAYGRLFTDEEYHDLRVRLRALGWGEPRSSSQRDTRCDEWTRAGRVRLRMYGHQVPQSGGAQATCWRRAE